MLNYPNFARTHHTKDDLNNFRASSPPFFIFFLSTIQNHIDCLGRQYSYCLGMSS